MPKSTKKSEKITKKTNLGALVQQYPKIGKMLAEEYGLHCVGCMAASFDSLEQGAKIHGYDDKEIGEMVKRLNELI